MAQIINTHLINFGFQIQMKFQQPVFQINNRWTNILIKNPNLLEPFLFNTEKIKEH